MQPSSRASPDAAAGFHVFAARQAWRGQPQILEIFVIPGAEGRAASAWWSTRFRIRVRAAAGRSAPHSAQVLSLPVTAGPGSFVLADKLAFCRFSYLDSAGWTRPTAAALVHPRFVGPDLAASRPHRDGSRSIRTPARLQPITMVAPIHVFCGHRRFHMAIIWVPGC